MPWYIALLLCFNVFKGTHTTTVGTVIFIAKFTDMQQVMQEHDLFQTVKHKQQGKIAQYKKVSAAPKGSITFWVYQAGTSKYIKLKLSVAWCQLTALFFTSGQKRQSTCTSSLPDESWFRSSVRMGGFVFFAHRAALLRVKWNGEQSAVNPVRECT